MIFTEKSAADLQKVVNGGSSTVACHAYQSTGVNCKTNDERLRSSDTSEAISHNFSNLDISVDCNGTKSEHNVASFNGDSELENEKDTCEEKGNSDCSASNHFKKDDENYLEVKCSKYHNETNHVVQNTSFNGSCENNKSTNHSKITTDQPSIGLPISEINVNCNGISDRETLDDVPTPQGLGSSSQLDCTCQANKTDCSQQFTAILSTASCTCNSGATCVGGRENEQTCDEYVLCYDEKVHTCRPGSTGLINLTNMCYVNSVVQCLSSATALRKYLLSKFLNLIPYLNLKCI